jgi:hypothetical protein
MRPTSGYFLHRPGTRRTKWFSCLSHPVPTVADLSFWTLLYRYFFFDWLFLDARRGDLFERAAAWRHNHEQAHWLLLYLRRWLCFGLLLYGLGACIEMWFNAPALSSFFYVPASLSVPVNVVIGVIWLGLRALPRPF